MCFWIKYKINPAKMIIGKKSFVIPTGIELSGDERIKRIFHDRKLLHEQSVPSFAVYIEESTWNAFLQKANEEYALRNNEASGIILGSYFKDDAGEYVVGTHFEAGNGSGTSSVFCEISIQDQVRIIQSAKEKKLLQVIWIHSHPSFGAFYSNVDYRTLKSMYYAPHQAGIVVDNVKGEYLGFKVRNNNAYEFKNIYLFKIDDDSQFSSRPFGKDPIKVFYAKDNSSITLNKKVKDPVSLKSGGKRIKQVKDTEVLAMIKKAMDDLKLLLADSQDKNDKLIQHRQNWEITIKQIEALLEEQYGGKPYRDVAPYFNMLNELRDLLNEKYSSANRARLQDKLNELLTDLSKS
jgi:proteasome lid subunit RPN8/RPN11